MTERSKVAVKGRRYASPLGASERVLADGRVVTPGTPVVLDGDAVQDPHNARLIKEGQLIEIREKKQEVSGETRS